MADSFSGTDLRNAMMQHARVTIAAALIQSRVIDLAGANFYDADLASQNPEFKKLKTAVDTVIKTLYS
jgi:uncharacterized protein YjbI with pentapeptide repeats